MARSNFMVATEAAGATAYGLSFAAPAPKA
jgi:hypothetical protein